MRIAKAGGIPLVLQAMKIHLSIAAVHQKACAVLRNLSPAPPPGPPGHRRQCRAAGRLKRGAHVLEQGTGPGDSVSRRGPSNPPQGGSSIFQPSPPIKCPSSPLVGRLRVSPLASGMPQLPCIQFCYFQRCFRVCGMRWGAGGMGHGRCCDV